MKPLERAIEIALKAHAGQTDKAGAPYVLHPLRMMLRMESETEMMAAVLHDVVEDGPGWTFERLADEGIPASVIEAVTYLTKRPEDEKDYEGFIRRAATHPVARRVKLADLTDNMDMGRINNPTEKDFVRLAKYRSAYALLKSLGDETQCPPNENPVNPSKPAAKPASLIRSTMALLDESSSPKRPPKKLDPSLQASSDRAMAAMLKNLNRPGDH